MAVNTWRDLATLRGRGQRPGLPVYVTDRPVLARNMRDVGCVAILHQSGERMPVELLKGLDVRLDFGCCELGGRVHRLMQAKGISANVRAWCRCARAFVATCGPCDEGDEPWAR